VPRVTGQLTFTFENHGEKSDGWLQSDYASGAGWTEAAAGDLLPLAKRPVRPRPIPKLLYGDRLPMRLVSQGVFTRIRKETNPAVLMQTDALAWRHEPELFTKPAPGQLTGSGGELSFNPDAITSATGYYVILDTGREEAGLLDLELEAPKGTVFEIAYGEHLEDLRVRASVGGRSFANRYVSPAGRHSFVHPFLRLAGRYIQVDITPAADAGKQPIALHYAGMRPTDYPVKQLGSFSCSDSLQNKIHEVSVRTLHLCMHEHYEDCPWREQSLYGMDARNQMLAGFYTFGNYDFAAASIQLLGQGYNPKDGWLELCAPASIPITIPSFSLAWILMVDDHLLFAGDREFAKSQLPTIKKVLATAVKESTGSVIQTPRGGRMWNFYEWAPGLDGAVYRDAKDTGDQFDAPLNLFYLLALDGAARIARETGEAEEDFAMRAAALRGAFHGAFWDEKEQAYLTKAGTNQSPHFAELTQALALIAGVVPPDKVDALRARLAADNNRLVPCTLSHMMYKFEAMMADPDKYAQRIFDLIRRDWGFMLQQGATSFWETIEGAAAFGDAGSLCHGWSAIPAWFQGAYILGVKPTAPGFTKYESKPVTHVFNRAEGKIPTPQGVLKVTLRDGKHQVERAEKP